MEKICENTTEAYSGRQILKNKQVKKHELSILLHIFLKINVTTKLTVDSISSIYSHSQVRENYLSIVHKSHF